MSERKEENNKLAEHLEIPAPFRHFDGSDCIGCDRPPKRRLPVQESQPVDLDCSEELASQSQESPDASDSFLPSIPEDEDMAMEDDPQYEAYKRWEELQDVKWEKVKGNYDTYCKGRFKDSIMERNRSIVP